MQRLLLLALILAASVGVARGRLNAESTLAVAQQRYGDATAVKAREWLATLHAAQSGAATAKLERINTFFNQQLAFRSDDEVWQQADYWATPLEALARGSGDCEDFAIAKYVSLIAAGIPRARLRLLYVKAQTGGGASPVQAHMVLGYYARGDGEPLILDNLVDDIRPASLRTDLTPIFSFNGDGLWAGSIKAASHPTERLSRWRDLLARLRDEGFQ